MGNWAGVVVWVVAGVVAGVEAGQKPQNEGTSRVEVLNQAVVGFSEDIGAASLVVVLVDIVVVGLVVVVAGSEDRTEDSGGNLAVGKEDNKVEAENWVEEVVSTVEVVAGVVNRAVAEVVVGAVAVVRTVGNVVQMGSRNSPGNPEATNPDRLQAAFELRFLVC